MYFQVTVVTGFNVSLILTAWAIGFILFEFPSGILADRRGKKNAFILSGTMCLVSFAILAVANSLMLFVLFELAYAFSNSLITGTDVAMLYESTMDYNAQAKDKPLNFNRIAGINKAMWPIGATISCLVGGLLGSINLRFPILATFIPFTLSAILSLFLVEPRRTLKKDKRVIVHVKNAIKEIYSNKQLLLIFIIGFITHATVEIAHQFKQLFFQDKGVPILFFGIFFVICDGMSALGSIISHRVVRRTGSKTILVVGCMIGTILTLLSTIVPNWVLVGILNTVPSIFWGINQPVWDLYINREIESDKRASIISASNLVNYLGFTAFMPMCGLLVDQFGVVVVIQVLSLLGVISLGGIFKLNEVKSQRVS